MPIDGWGEPRPWWWWGCSVSGVKHVYATLLWKLFNAFILKYIWYVCVNSYPVFWHHMVSWCRFTDWCIKLNSLPLCLLEIIPPFIPILQLSHTILPNAFVQLPPIRLEFEYDRYISLWPLGHLWQLSIGIWGCHVRALLCSLPCTISLLIFHLPIKKYKKKMYANSYNMCSADSAVAPNIYHPMPNQFCTEHLSSSLIKRKTGKNNKTHNIS